jgi:hypothetical protein
MEQNKSESWAAFRIRPNTAACDFYFFSFSFSFSSYLNLNLNFNSNSNLVAPHLLTLFAQLKILSLKIFIYIFISLLFSLFSNPNFHLGFNPTIRIIISLLLYLLFLFNAQTYKTPTRCTLFYFSVIGLI